ncbi:MAG: AraC family transcriptional regulator [Eubacteriales bacterium]|nr:AraC family transcriptional regulator [Eubacteriales bacterium]
MTEKPTNDIEKRDLTRWYMQREDLEAFYYEHRYISETPIHYHIGFNEIYLFLEGDVNYHIHKENYKLSYGDLLLIPAGIMHWPEIHNTTGTYKRMFLWISQKYIEKLSSENTDLLQCFSSGKTLIHLSGKEVLKIKYLMEELIQVKKGQFGEDVLRASLLSQILVHICMFLKDSKPQVKHNSRLQTIVDYIDGEISDSALSIEKIAKQFYLSKSALSRAFTKDMGITPYRYIAKRRLHMARQKLSQGDSPLNVSNSVGYSDYSAFYRAFVKEFGQSPASVKDTAD